MGLIQIFLDHFKEGKRMGRKSKPRYSKVEFKSFDIYYLVSYLFSTHLLCIVFDTIEFTRFNSYMISDGQRCENIITKKISKIISVSNAIEGIDDNGNNGLQIVELE